MVITRHESNVKTRNQRGSRGSRYQRPEMRGPTIFARATAFSYLYARSRSAPAKRSRDLPDQRAPGRKTHRGSIVATKSGTTTPERDDAQSRWWKTVGVSFV